MPSTEFADPHERFHSPVASSGRDRFGDEG